MMKRVAILRCLHSNVICTGAACLNAYFKRLGSFSIYGQEELQLVAFWTFNGCNDCCLKNEACMEEKIQRIISLQTEVIHIGLCTEQKDDNGKKQICPTIQKICQRLRRSGITIVKGTH